MADGQVITSGIGSVVKGVSIALLGLAMTASQGEIRAGQDPDDTKIEVFAGNIAALDSETALTGSAITGEQGTLVATPDADFALTGNESVGGAGTPVAMMEVVLFGITLTGAQGQFGAPGGAILTGQEILSAQGTIHTDGDRTYPITGQGMMLSMGSVGVGPRVPLTGLLGTLSSGTFNPVGGSMEQALTGQVIRLNNGRLVQEGGDTPRGSGSNEGCSVTSAVALEGCGIVAGVAEETLEED